MVDWMFFHCFGVCVVVFVATWWFTWRALCCLMFFFIVLVCFVVDWWFADAFVVCLEGFVLDW